MSYYGPFNLDELNSTSFQSLCNAVLQDQFRLMTPLIRPGPDGGLDGKNEFAISTYDELVNKPFNFTAPNGSDTFWVFQCKFTQKERDKDRERAVEKELNKEIENWETRERKPTHYIYLTNVALTAGAVARLEAIGKKAFEFFEIWHEPKIANFVSLNVGLQKAYFPHRITSMNLATVVDLTEAIQIKTVAPAVNTTPAALAEPEEAVRQLVEFEIAFLKSNEAFFENFKIDQKPKDVPADWQDLKYPAKQSGILNLSTDSNALSWLIQKIQTGQLTVRAWNIYLGEQAKVGNDIATLACSPDQIGELTSKLDAAFEYVPGELKAHVKVDEYLKSLEANILTASKLNRVQDVKDGLRSFLNARKTYISAKKGAPDAFYPNTRRWGIRPVFGWDFLGLWDDVLRNVCNLIFADKQPADLYDFLIYLPFSLATEVVHKGLSKVTFQAEIHTLTIIFWEIVKGRPDLLESFLNRLDSLAEEIPDLKNNIATIERARWAKEISTELAKYIGELGYLALSKKAPLILDQLKAPLEKATNINFSGLSSDDLIADYSKLIALRKEFALEINECKNERYFAWATYAWHKERDGGNFDPKLPLNLVAGLSVKEICRLYAKNEDRDYGWHSSWFWPENAGKRVAIWRSVDHDLRELLQLVVVSRPITEADFEPIGHLEVESEIKKFTEETKALYDTLAAKGHRFTSWSKVESVLKAVHESRKTALLQLIRSQNELQSEKVDQVTADFRKALLEQSHEGSLFNVDESLASRGLKAEFNVGVLSLERKETFVKDTGYMSHSVHGIGTWWAEAIIAGRLQLLIKRALEIAVIKTSSKDKLKDVLENIRDNFGEDYALLVAYGMIPWRICDGFILNEHKLKEQGLPNRAGRRGRLGDVDVYYEKIPPGEILLVKKNSFTWVTEKRREKPQIELIDPTSEVAKKILEKNPETDLALRVVVSANESGLMVFDDAAPKPIIFRFALTEDGNAVNSRCA